MPLKNTSDAHKYKTTPPQRFSTKSQLPCTEYETQLPALIVSARPIRIRSERFQGTRDFGNNHFSA